MMSQPAQAREPFVFCTRLHLSELTGLKASNLTQLLDLIKNVPGSSIYHHTHRFLQQHQYLSPEPPNDFAYWVTNALGESELGEDLASIDTVRFSTIRELRDEIASVIEGYAERHGESLSRSVHRGEEFHFLKSVSFVITTGYAAGSLGEFREILKKITVESIYYHIFEAKLRLGKKTNDFSLWIEESAGDSVLAIDISRLDPYTHTMEDLRNTIVKLVEKRIKGVK